MTKSKTTKRNRKSSKESSLNSESSKWKDVLRFTLDKDILKAERIRFFIGILVILFALFMTLAFASYITTGQKDQSTIERLENSNVTTPSAVSIAVNVHNSTGLFGAKMSYFFLQKMFGLPSFFIPLFLVFFGLWLMRSLPNAHLLRKFVNYAFLMIWLSVALAFFVGDSFNAQFTFPPGGEHGDFIQDYLGSLIGKPGLFILLLITALGYLIYLSHRTIVIIRKMMNGEYFASFMSKVKSFINRIKSLNGRPQMQPVPANAQTEAKEADRAGITFDAQVPNPEPISTPPVTIPDNTSDSTTKPKKNGEIEIVKTEEDKHANSNTAINNEDYDPKMDLEFYKYPPLSLLQSYDTQNTSIDMDELNEYKTKITTVLHNFGVEINTIKATVGPTITLYEITPAQGVRVSKIRGLEDDIALSLSALGIRIIAPIPGKGTIGIEVPNKKPQIVSGESILNSKKFLECNYELPIALGKTITNDVYIKDLAHMPHLLVAGATGQGKSVGLNAIITSLLYKKHPSELKLVLIDPKKVEFSIYTPLANHFLAMMPDEIDPIITDVSKVVRTLNSLCKEMDDRYALMKRAGCRNIKEYNTLFKARKLNPQNGHHFLPYFVIIIDEFGDLIMTAGKEIELPIARIAQLARAVGMHMVIATQRPTTNIITGTIKANFPARMAFKVSAQIDSRTILDQGGADKLVGRGDMLIMAGTMLPERVQCAFIDTPEVVRINQFISEQQGYLHPYELPEVNSDENGSSDSSENTVDSLDPMFEEVARMVVANQQGSTSWLQRKYSIGYNRAGRLMDQLEQYGIVGAAHGSKPREVLIQDENHLNTLLENLH